MTARQASDCPLKTPLPKTWPESVKSAVLHAIALGQYALSHTRGWAADSANARLRLKAENDRLKAEVSLLCEEIRIKDTRMARIDPHHRPNYVWHVDLTIVPTGLGFWCSWLPWALP